MNYDREACWCDGCGVEITWGPWFKDGRPYCCEDCMRGWPCRCRERVDLEDERRPSASIAVSAGYQDD